MFSSTDPRYEKRSLRMEAKRIAKHLADRLKEVDACMSMFDSDVPLLYEKLHAGATALGERAYRLAAFAKKLGEMTEIQRRLKEAENE